jgi:type II secretory pathway pseudopilin PulG
MHTFTNSSPVVPNREASGLSLVEILLVVSLLAVIGSAAVIQISDSRASADKAKLVNDAGVLNRAITAYISSSGKVAEGSDAAVVIELLKRRASETSASRLPGFSGGFLDPRVTPVFQTEEESRSDAPRLLWNALTGRFDVATSGGLGIKRIVFSATEAEVGEEEREASLSYGVRDGWVWDYTEAPLPQNPGSSYLPTVLDPTNSSPPLPVASGAPSSSGPVPKASLAAPSISPSSGIFPAATYPVPIRITNPNPAGSSTLWVSSDFGPWFALTADPFPLPIGGSSLRAQAVPNDPDLWESSGITSAGYGVSPSKLLPPDIQSTSDRFQKGTVEEIHLTLRNTNDPAVSGVRYRLAGEGWTDYAMVIPTRLETFPLGYRVEAVAVPTSPYWIASDPAEATVMGQSLGDLVGFDASVSVEVAVSGSTPPPGSFVSIRDGDWNDPDTWQGGVVPGTNLSGAAVVVKNRVNYWGGTLDVSDGTLRVEGILSVDNQNIKLEHADGRVEIVGGLIIIDNANFDIEYGLARFDGGGMQICNGNYVNKEPSRGTEGSGYIYVNNGGIDRVGSSPFSSAIAWAAPLGSGTNLPTPENPAAATPPGGCRDESHFRGSSGEARRATFTFRFSNPGTEPLEVAFHSLLPSPFHWDESFEAQASPGLSLGEVRFPADGREVEIKVLRLPPGDSTLVLSALSAETTGSYQLESELRVLEPESSSLRLDIPVSLGLP